MTSSDGITSDGSSGKAGNLSAWPDESASTKQVGDWLDANMPYLMKTYGFIVRGETPPSLLKFTADVDDGGEHRRDRRGALSHPSGGPEPGRTGSDAAGAGCAPRCADAARGEFQAPPSEGPRALAALVVQAGRYLKPQFDADIRHGW